MQCYSVLQSLLNNFCCKLRPWRHFDQCGKTFILMAIISTLMSLGSASASLEA